jgi:hypothetical protein
MINPNIPNMPNIPGMGAMTDTLDFVKNLWGSMGLPGMSVPGMPGMNVPGMVMPTLSVDEINKRISDLKAVETWLNLNMGMLRGTIQALEVQAATISTLQTMGERFTATMNPGGQNAGQAASSGSNGSTASSGANGQGAERVHNPPPEPTSKDEQDAASLTAPLVNAAAWWNMLQDQFKQAVNTAMTETQAVAAAATSPVTEKPKAKASAKPKAASSSSSSSASSTTARKRKTSK